MLSRRICVQVQNRKREKYYGGIRSNKPVEKQNNVQKPLCSGVSMKSGDTIENYREGPQIDRSYFIYDIFPVLDGIRKIDMKRIGRKKEDKKYCRKIRSCTKLSQPRFICPLGRVSGKINVLRFYSKIRRTLLCVSLSSLIFYLTRLMRTIHETFFLPFLYLLRASGFLFRTSYICPFSKDLRNIEKSLNN